MAIFFKDFGKGAKDTINDDYIFEKKLELKSTTVDGTVLTATGVRGAAGSIAGSLQIKKPIKTTSLTGKLETSGKISIDVVSDNYISGLKATLNAVPQGQDIKPSAKLTCEYKSGNTTITSSVDPLKAGPEFTASLSSIFKDISFGGETTCNFGKCGSCCDLSCLTASKVGVQYTNGPLTLLGVLENNLSDLRVSYIHKLNENLTAAGEFSHGLYAKKTALTLGVNYKIDDNTSTRAKLNSDGLLSLVYSYKLKKSTTLRLGVQMDAANLSADKNKIGLALLVDEK